MQGNLRRRRPPTRGSLAVWQQRIVATYIEEHLAEAISLHALAKLVDLSPYYFCRAFKQSFGIPPHRYHVNRRIERAKALLGERESSVTDVALEVGFSETSSVLGGVPPYDRDHSNRISPHAGMKPRPRGTEA